MSHINKRVPKRRFEEFNNTDDWEQRKLGEIANSFEYGLNASSKTYDGENKYIRITDIDESSHVFNHDNLTSPDISLDNLNHYLLEEGDILLARTGASTGKSYCYNKIDGKVFFAGFLIRAKIKHEYNVSFIFQSTLTERYNNFIQVTSQRSGQPGINAQEYARFALYIPKLKEQQKIGDFFKQLDNTITLHQRKLEKIKALKTAYLSEMFPAEGETEPKRRFAGFTDDWDQRKLGELAKIVRGASPRPIQDPKWFDNNSEVGWLRISDVTAQDGRINYLEQRISEAGQGKTKVLKEPHLLLSIAATVGKPVINYVKTGVHDGFLIFLDIKFEQEFLFQWLEMFRTSWQKYGQPGSQINLNSELVRNQEISIPSMNEQIKISKLFQQLDNAITLHQRKLQKLQNIKKAYLNEMFI
ncbi:restriction endonuclease subunit S [Listeria welshimeri]|uniref:restriction endonuclease subunit S n=1 Tax=Listeria welshimeri TaxID=1643 RepID=UPI00180937AC|nr:restriction endonuclease subunit S [Listeria welshimeri]MBC1948973.1 restriction endonuclease subunit S [Listeria welshimeri]